MQAYEWQCHVCRHSNSAARDTCSACGFAAAARGKDILLKRAAQADAAEAAPPASSDSVNLTELVAYLPLWRRILAYVGLMVSGAGGIWWKFAWTMPSYGSAFLMVAGGLLLVGLAAGRKTAPSPPP
ncbi:hypothetical protein CR152_01630 [Massilia violaceinigra]|uniref:RanBP2-type domain-containing protein n=1 Tax=Massilia violaceinigra TaxID=2045208 RepID=A0A2D2DEJ5_9BURK|nr:zinc finger Ran-binding domain-containing protein [Massilia violaceinigra]ATQ73349.1 hypothetical protein CR152_01630 [Massilia violaceinigra]